MTTLLFSLVLISFAAAEEAKPEREKGLSAHMLPDRIAGLRGGKGGFDIRPQHEIKEAVVIQKAEQLVEYFKKLSAPVQANGIWVVTTHPRAYAEAEIANLERLKALCKQEKIALFVVRGAELPDGWKRES